jgi:hypothetical protein
MNSHRPLLLTIVIVSMFCMILSAFARDPDGRYAGSPLHNWFDSLVSGKGPCCSNADGKIIPDVDWESKDGHYRVRIDGEWVDVPDSAVLKQPNLDGRTIVWPMYEGGKITPRCFIAGSGT